MIDALCNKLIVYYSGTDYSGIYIMDSVTFTNTLNLGATGSVNW